MGLRVDFRGRGTASRLRALAQRRQSLRAERGVRALRHALVFLGIPTEPDGGPQEKNFRVHVDRLWPLGNWSVHSRHAHRSRLGRADGGPHRDAAVRRLNERISLDESR